MEVFLWAVTLLIMWASILNIQKKISCFYIWFLTSGVLFWYNISIKEWQQGTIWGFYIFVNLWGIMKWRKENRVENIKFDTTATPLHEKFAEIMSEVPEKELAKINEGSKMSDEDFNKTLKRVKERTKNMWNIPRDPKRIDKVLKELSIYWKKNTDLRLAQIIGNFAPMKDPYHYEDTELLNELRKANGKRSIK